MRNDIDAYLLANSINMAGRENVMVTTASSSVERMIRGSVERQREKSDKKERKERAAYKGVTLS